ncbi:5372_t:CDS:2 [Acaulospora morrowiae]|uniref:5372_t:CDS:1 n=1 Tax=Acaulospora morrowiae TaxID=94023 RepID=A0A9N8W2F0_9GLOM|nr:5372_t:CDS:2 [Acaulospora morrowiae]
MRTRFYDNLSQDFSQLLEDADDYNVKIEVGKGDETQEFRAHSIILRARSPYFKRALSESWATIKDGIILFNKPNVSPIVFTLILKYIYSGILDLSKVSNDDVIDLLVASDELLLGELSDHIQNYLIKREASWLQSNLIKILDKVFSLFNSGELVNHCMESICETPVPFFTSNDFLSLNENILFELIKREELTLEETDIWESLIKWGIHQTPGIETSDAEKFSEQHFENLKETLDRFIPYIRFHEISPKDFFNKVRPFRKILPESLFEDIMSFLMAGTELKQKKLPSRMASFMDKSKILTRKHANIISNWIGRKDTSKANRYRFTLLYRGTRDNLNLTLFRQKVNDQGPVIAVVKIKGSETIIGGFNASGWSKDQYDQYDYYESDKWINNNSHFIFSFKSLNDKKGIIGRSCEFYGVCDEESYFLYFGCGDLLLREDKIGSCYQHSYDKEILDTDSFIAEELEIFKIRKIKSR